MSTANEYCPFSEYQLEELQSEWEQCVDPSSSSWPAFLAKAIDNYDPSPWCQYCGAKTRKACDCGPIANNN
jgi:hypothetical protein